MKLKEAILQAIHIAVTLLGRYEYEKLARKIPCERCFSRELNPIYFGVRQTRNHTEPTRRLSAIDCTLFSNSIL